MLEYKAKYLELKARLIESTELSYRLGYEKGYNDCQNEAQAQAIGQLTQQNQPNPNDPNAQDPNAQNPMQDPNAQAPGVDETLEAQQNQQNQVDQNKAAQQGANPPPGSELDQHITELEGLVAKGEKPSLISIREVVMKLADVRKSQNSKVEAKNTKAVSAQKQLVNKLIASWDSEKNKELDIDQIIKESGMEIETSK
jgi:hypothetical protein